MSNHCGKYPKCGCSPEIGTRCHLSMEEIEKDSIEMQKIENESWVKEFEKSYKEIENDDLIVNDEDFHPNILEPFTIKDDSNPLEDLLLKFEESTEEAKEVIIQQIEIDKKKLVLNKYVESLKGMKRRHIIRAMKRKATELGLNEIQ